MKYEWVAANHNSQRVSHSSTARNADELNYRVRDGYGWNLVAMAAETDHRNRTSVKPLSAILPPHDRSFDYSCIRAIQFAPGPITVGHSA